MRTRLCKCGAIKADGAACSSPRCHVAPIAEPRGSASERGYDPWWTEYSLRYRDAHPYCVACEAAGIFTPACLVDHIVPFHRTDGSIDERLRQDPNNHQSLCDGRYRDCHGRLKKPIEMKYRGSPDLIRDAWEQLLASFRESGSRVEVT